MEKIKTVIFDMDGLMFDTEKVYFKINQKVAHELGMDYTFDVYSQFVGSGLEQEYDGMVEHFKDKQLVDEYFDQTGPLLEEAFKTGPIDSMPGLMSLLDYLREENIPAIVASSTRRELVEHMTKRLGVRDCFVDVVGGDEVPFAKPDPAIFNKAFELTGLTNKKEALVLEDSKNGVLASYNAGIPVILVPNMLDPDDEMKEKALAVMPDLVRVKDFIKEQQQS